MMLSLLPLDGSCNCCSGPDLLRWHGLARKADPDQSRIALREDGIIEEEGEDAFLDDELIIAAALAGAWAEAAAKAKPIILNSIDRYSPGNVQSAVDEVTPIMSSIYDNAAEEVGDAVRSTLTTGIGVGGAGMLSGFPVMSTPSAQTFESSIIAATRYVTNRFFNANVVPAIIRSIDAAFDRVDAPDLNAIKQAIAVHFRTVPYWELVANLAASRGYHYGMLRALQARNIIAYRFVAVIDGRTSAICRSMNGREFLVADAVNLLDGLANDPDPMAAKTRTPWVKPEAVEGKSSRDLATMGVMVPPLHPRCRSTIVPIYA